MKRLSGFSLMEMMIVLTIVAIVAAASAPMVNRKMVKNATEQQSLWSLINNGPSIGFNFDQGATQNNTTVNIGGIAPGSANSPKLYINTPASNGNDATSHIAFGSNNGNIYQLIAGGGSNNIYLGNSDAYSTLLDNTTKDSIFLGYFKADATVKAAKESVTLGYNSLSYAPKGVAIGYNVLATRRSDGSNLLNNSGAIAIGNNVESAGDNSIAIGGTLDATKNSSIAIGQNSTIKNEKAVAIGSDINTANIAIGSDIEANGYGTIAIAKNSTIDEYGVAVGNDTTTGVSGIAIGWGSTAGKDAIAIGSIPTFGYGDEKTSAGQGAVAIGRNSQSINLSSAAVGYGSYADGVSAIAFGQSASAKGAGSMAIGSNASANGTYAVAIGADATSTGNNQITIGTDKDAVVIPGDLIVQGNVVLGSTNKRVIVWPFKNNYYLLLHSDSSDQHMCIRKETTATKFNNGTIITSQSSDRRLKNVGETFKAGLAEIKKLEVFNYTFKDDKDKTPRVGVMAQDLKKIFPKAVTKGEDGFLVIRMEDMFYAVINAVKELDKMFTCHSKRIEELEKQNAEQQENISKLEMQNKELIKRIEALEKVR